MNIKNYERVLDQIMQHSETWNQSSWHNECGTKHCFAGWAQVLSGNRICGDTVEIDAGKWLQLNERQARYLYNPDRTVEDFQQFLKLQKELEEEKEKQDGKKD